MPNALHPDEFLLVASRATLGHTVSPEELQGATNTHARLMAEAFNDPKKKAALTAQFERQRQFVKDFDFKS